MPPEKWHQIARDALARRRRNLLARLVQRNVVDVEIRRLRHSHHEPQTVHAVGAHVATPLVQRDDETLESVAVAGPVETELLGLHVVCGVDHERHQVAAACGRDNVEGDAVVAAPVGKSLGNLEYRSRIGTEFLDSFPPRREAEPVRTLAARRKGVGDGKSVIGRLVCQHHALGALRPLEVEKHRCRRSGNDRQEKRRTRRCFHDIHFFHLTEIRTILSAPSLPTPLTA